MGYNFFSDIFKNVEQSIDRGLYDHAYDALIKIRKNGLNSPQKVYSDILLSNIYSHQGQFCAALDLQQKILIPPP
jgi:hypothetical protein